MDKVGIISEFLRILGEPKDSISFYEYIDLCYSVSNEVDEMECHHILPRAIWPLFENLKENDWNKSIMISKDHSYAHFLLYKAYPIAEFWFPVRLRYDMDSGLIIPQLSKEVRSKKAKEYWEKIKTDTDKYDKICNNYSNYMMTRWKDKSYREYMISVANRTAKDDRINLIRSEKSKEFWSEKSYDDRVKFLKNTQTEEANLKRSKSMEGLWEDDIFREKHKTSMEIARGREGYSENMSDKLKELWKDPEYIRKTNEARQKALSNPEVKAKKSEAAKRKWADPEYRDMMLKRRKDKKDENSKDRKE